MPRGRPRAFHLDKALDQALSLFWRHGYDGTSVAMLTQAMGINGPSLYAAFGNKEKLFHRALAYYSDRYGAYFRQALTESTARLVAERLFEGAIRQVTQPDHPCGCLLVQGALAGSDSADPARLALRDHRHSAEAAIRTRFERAIAEGDLPADADAALLARYVFTINLGFAVQAAGGATRDQLQAAADLAMLAFPVDNPTPDNQASRSID